MIYKKTERGQALILIALAAIGLFAFAALAIDSSRSFSNKRHAQNAADTAVLAAALAHIREPVEANKFTEAKKAAEKLAKDNGYYNADPTGKTIAVEVNLCSDAGITCEGINTAYPEQYLRVRIRSQIPSTFGRVIGWEILESAAEAIARVQGSSSTSSYPDDAVVALNKTGCGICNSGNGDLTVNNSGAFSNSTTICNPPAKGSMDFNGNVTVFATDGFTVVSPGDICFNGNADYGAGSGTKKLGSQISPVYKAPVPNVTCSDPGWEDTATKQVHPGYFPAKLNLPNSTWTFLPGDYCFANGVQASANITADNVNFRIDGGEFRHTGDVFTCSNMIVYGAGGSGIHFNGNGNNTCTSVTFYMASGGVTWNGTSEQNLKAPTSGDYKGLLIYLPVGNTSLVRLNGTTDSELVGSVIAPGSQIQLSGVADSKGFDTQLVGAWIDIDGGSNTVINYNPNNQYVPPAQPSIELTK